MGLPDRGDRGVTEGAARGDTRRLFFALWPDEACRERLSRAADRLHAALGGRVTHRLSIHLTLLFLGDLPAARVPAAESIAQGVSMDPFTLTMAAAGCWPHNRIAWMAPDQTPPGLAALVYDLRANASAAGFAVENRPFTPHVTLLRRAQCRPMVWQMDGFEWQATDFVLVRSQLASDGARYEIIRRWPA